MQDLKLSEPNELMRRPVDAEMFKLAQQTRLMANNFLDSPRWATVCANEQIVAITRRISKGTIERGYLRLLEVLRRWGTFYSFDELAELIFPNLDRIEKAYDQATNTIAIIVYLLPTQKIWATADGSKAIQTSTGELIVFDVPTTTQKAGDYEYLCNYLTQRRKITIEVRSV